MRRTELLLVGILAIELFAGAAVHAETLVSEISRTVDSIGPPATAIFGSTKAPVGQRTDSLR
jgi:hypothetical protein